MTSRISPYVVFAALAGAVGALALSILTLVAGGQWAAAGGVAVVALAILIFGVIAHGMLRRMEEGERWLHTIVTGAPDAIIAVGGDGLIRRCNPAGEKLFGYRQGALAGRPFAILLPADSGVDDRGEGTGFEAVLHQMGLRPGERVTLSGLRRDGGRFHMELSVSVLDFPDDAVYTVIARDVSAQIHAQEALREVHASLEARVEARTAELRAQMEARAHTEAQREKLVEELRVAVSQIRTLRGLLPICASCKRVRDDQGYWQQIESFVRDHSEAEFSHGICPVCRDALYPELGAEAEAGPETP